MLPHSSIIMKILNVEQMKKLQGGTTNLPKCLLGTVGAGMLGGVGGASLGSVAPGVGTIVGAGIGAIGGAMSGAAASCF